jgi:hypothetical protein
VPFRVLDVQGGTTHALAPDLPQNASGSYRVIALFFFFSTYNAARADLLPVFVDVNFNSTATQAYSDQGTVAGITFLQNPTYRQSIASGGDVGTSVTIRRFISPTAKSGETFTFTDRPFDLVMKLTDEPSGASGILSFAGTFSGTLSLQSAQIFATMSWW